jgi:hypothetical protein
LKKRQIYRYKFVRKINRIEKTAGVFSQKSPAQPVTENLSSKN